MRVLILGGTGEARALAARLRDVPGLTFVSSLAGRVSNPALPVGEVRVGGFGGRAGLAHYLRASAIDVLVDATHPFAATISDHAAAAARETATRLIVLQRPGWSEGPGDDWLRVPSIAAAATVVRNLPPPGAVFVTTGRRDLAAFAGDAIHHFVVRTVEPPAPPLPPQMDLVLARGPYTLDGELALMRAHHVQALVTKDSGGTMTAAKLAAARELGLMIVMIDRPPLPAGVAAVASVDDVFTALDIAAG